MCVHLFVAHTAVGTGQEEGAESKDMHLCAGEGVDRDAVCEALSSLRGKPEGGGGRRAIATHKTENCSQPQAFPSTLRSVFANRSSHSLLRNE